MESNIQLLATLLVQLMQLWMDLMHYYYPFDFMIEEDIHFTLTGIEPMADKKHLVSRHNNRSISHTTHEGVPQYSVVLYFGLIP